MSNYYKIEKLMAEKYAISCTLLNKDFELPTCYGFPDECKTCEVPKHYEKAEKGLEKILNPKP